MTAADIYSLQVDRDFSSGHKGAIKQEITTMVMNLYDQCIFLILMSTLNANPEPPAYVYPEQVHLSFGGKFTYAYQVSYSIHDDY